MTFLALSKASVVTAPFVSVIVEMLDFPSLLSGYLLRFINSLRSAHYDVFQAFVF